MTYEEKLLTILNAIQQARKNSINTSRVKLFIAKADGLKDFDPSEIYDILYKIEQQEKILIVRDTPSHIERYDIDDDEERFNHALSENTYFVLELLDRFDTWYNNLTSSHKTINLQIAFDNATGILTINGNDVSLQTNSFRTELLALVMKNRNKVLQWDDVTEKILGISNIEEPQKYKSKFYSACDGLQKRIAQKIGINDFLIFTKSTVQLNPKYL